MRCAPFRFRVYACVQVSLLGAHDNMPVALLFAPRGAADSADGLSLAVSFLKPKCRRSLWEIIRMVSHRVRLPDFGRPVARIVVVVGNYTQAKESALVRAVEQAVMVLPIPTCIDAYP